MGLKSFANTRFGNIIMNILASIMESRLRYRFFGPDRILAGSGILPGKSVLEIGCGTGFFTIPAAKLIGYNGSLIALDILPGSVSLVTRKVKDAGLTNVTVIEADALNTELDAGKFDIVLLFGVIPSPTMPYPKLFAEMHRVLKDDGILAVWPPIPKFLPGVVTQSGLFEAIEKRNSVWSFRKK